MLFRSRGSDTEITYLRDTGATMSIVCQEVFKGQTPSYTGERVTIRGINQVAGTYPIVNLVIDSDIYCGSVKAAVVGHSPLPGVSLLLGNEVFAQKESLTIPCGVVTRARAQREASSLGDCDTSLLWKSPEPSGDREADVVEQQEAESDIDAESRPDSVTPPDLGDQIGLGPTALLQSQMDDSTLVPLWELAGDRKSVV